MTPDKTLFTIGEISKAVGVTRRIILNYEAKGLIVPDKKEEPCGNRYYSIDTLVKIRTIRVFQKLNLSLDEIRGYFDDSLELMPLIHRLEALRDELNLSIEKLYERTGTGGGGEIKEITLEPQTVFQKTAVVSSLAEKTEFLRNTALKAMRKYGTDTTKRMYYTEYNFAFPGRVLFCVSVPAESSGEGVFSVPKTRALSLYHRGAYEDLGQTVSKLTEYAKTHGRETVGVYRYIYLEGPPQHKDKSRFVTQVVLLLKNS